MKNRNININIQPAKSDDSKLSTFAKSWNQLFTWIANAPTFRLFKVTIFIILLVSAIIVSIFCYHAF